MVRYRRADRIEVALIEWKYTESYDDASSPSQVEARERRYRPIIDRNGGLFRSDRTIALARLCVEPFYQLLRQQLLAREVERARVLDADVVRVLHLSPCANASYARGSAARLSHLGATPTAVWTALLARPGRFVPAAIEEIFGSSLHPDAAALLTGAWQRYAFTSDAKANVRDPSSQR